MVSDIEVLSLGFMLLMLWMLVINLLPILNELILIVVMVDSGVNLDFFWLLQILNFGVLLNEPLVFSTFVKDLRSLCKLPLALQFFQYPGHLKLLFTPWSSFLVEKAFQVIHFFFERSFTQLGLIGFLHLLWNLFQPCIAFHHLLFFSLHSDLKLFFLGEATAHLPLQFGQLKLRQACKKIVFICDLGVALHFLLHELGLVGLLKDFVVRIQRCQSDDHPLAVRHVVEIHPQIYFLGVCFHFKHFL